ncbi:MAG TPA: UDP-glucose 4-epimerase GalE, partial [Nitrospirota bacterium]|nr:UDP-glucose 4-epimerase GalE [Nitrospirota bacterium]
FNNVGNTINLLHVLVQCSIKRFIFSSSAAVYGIPEQVPIPETEGLKPINPYGEAKAAVERMLRDLSAASDFRYVALRYFNAAGASSSGEIGEQHTPESHVIPLILKTAKGERDVFTIFGTDYPTEDGTCIRDYIHVEDLAEAHLQSLQYLLDSGNSTIFNCGYGHGYSVLEILEAVKRITSAHVAVKHGTRREGDAPVLVADSSKMIRELSWKPHYDDLDYIIKTAWEWERRR